MPFLVGCLAIGTPRFAIVLVVLFSDYIGEAYQTTIWPLMGFFLMPLTTLSYAFAMNSNGSVEGMYLVLLVVTGRMSHRVSSRYAIPAVPFLLLALARLRFVDRRWAVFGTLMGAAIGLVSVYALVTAQPSAYPSPPS